MKRLPACFTTALPALPAPHCPPHPSARLSPPTPPAHFRLPPRAPHAAPPRACTPSAIETVSVQNTRVRLLTKRPRGMQLASANFHAELRRLAAMHTHSVPPGTPAHAVAGVDEAGAGSLAGPVVAAAVILPRAPLLEGLHDSKLLSPARRADILRSILALPAAHVGVASASAREVDALNVRRARFVAMRRALRALARDAPAAPRLVLVDGDVTPADALRGAEHVLVETLGNEWGGLACEWEEVAEVGGDARCAAVAAASIVAKEMRDELMRDFAVEWPAYGFERNAGYGTREHGDALLRVGPCPLHRMSFKPVRAARERHAAA